MTKLLKTDRGRAMKLLLEAMRADAFARTFTTQAGVDFATDIAAACTVDLGCLAHYEGYDYPVLRQESPGFSYGDELPSAQ
jgi:hypothetical protein